MIFERIIIAAGWILIAIGWTLKTVFLGIGWILKAALEVFCVFGWVMGLASPLVYIVLLFVPIPDFPGVPRPGGESLFWGWIAGFAISCLSAWFSFRMLKDEHGWFGGTAQSWD